MMRSGHYDSFTDRYDDWFNRWFKTGPYGAAYSREPARLDLATSNRMRYYAYNAPVVGDFFRAGASYGELESYMASNGLGWDSIDPLRASSKFGSADSKAMATALKLSKNVLKLYR